MALINYFLRHASIKVVGAGAILKGELENADALKIFVLHIIAQLSEVIVGLPLMVMARDVAMTTTQISEAAAEESWRLLVDSLEKAFGLEPE